jgi:putative MATE family efflux protein
MKDLTTGSIGSHLASMSGQIAFGIVIQTMYFLVDLYFVSRLGDASIAGVGSASNFWFIVVAMSQILSVGIVALISNAVGAQQRHEANRVFNQSLLLAGICGGAVLLAVYALAGVYMRFTAADEAVVKAGSDYLHWYGPGLALQFAIVAMSATLRATGVVKPTIVLQMITVLVNILLAPVLIAGWGTGHAMGAAGAGLASTIAVVVGVFLFAWYFHRHEKYVAVHREQLRPEPRVWSRMLLIGMPVGAEFFLMSVVAAITYWVIRDFGTAAQAAVGVVQPVMRAIMLPAMAVAFAAAPIAGQNFGARKLDRVRQTFTVATWTGIALMLALTALVHVEADLFIHFFTTQPEVVAVAVTMLVISSWNFAATAVVFTCSSLFQALGNTMPTLISSGIRFAAFLLPLLWLSTRPGFQLEQVWWVSVGSIFVQAVIGWFLLQREFTRKLTPS